MLKSPYNPEDGTMLIAGLISGSGSNLIKIIEHGKRIDKERGRSLYQVVAIFSDSPESNAIKIGNDYGIPSVVNDLEAFCKERGKDVRDMQVRREFDAQTCELLKPYNIDVIACAGYMKRLTGALFNRFLCVNVHPADLTVMVEGKKLYTGDRAVEKAILAGAKELRATTHIVEERVDYGGILMVSAPLPVTLPEGFDATNIELVKRVASEHQNRLKEVGDWVIFPMTLEYIAQGRFARDEQGNLYFDGKPIPQGLRL